MYCISNVCDFDKRLNFVLDGRIKPVMNLNGLNTLGQLELFLTGSQVATLLVVNSKDELMRISSKAFFLKQGVTGFRVY